MRRETIVLPPFADRARNISNTKKGWRIVNPNHSRTFKAAQVGKFNSRDGDVYIVFRIVDRRGETADD